MLTKQDLPKIELLFMFLGLLFGTACFFIPIKYLLLISVGVIGIILVLWKLEIGLFAVVFLLPFIPTMATVGLSILIVISFIIRVIVNPINIKFSPMSLWICIFGALTLLYSLSSVTLISSIQVAMVVLSFIALFFVTINVVKDKNMIYALILTLIASASIESVYGLYQYKIGVQPIGEGWTDTKTFGNITRVYGTLDNPNILAQYLEFIIPLTLGAFLTVKNYFKKLMLLGLSALMILCLVATASRGGWVAFGLSVIVFGVLKDRRVLFLGIIAAAIGINFLPNSFIQRLSSVVNLSESSNSYRTFIWASTWNMIKDFWYSGVGLGVDAFKQLYNTRYIREGVFAFHSHNLYLELLAETGILGLLSFLSIVFMTFRNGLKTFISTKDNFYKTILATLLGGIVAFLFHGISENSFYNFKIVFLFWFIISLVMSIREIQTAENNIESIGE